MKLTLKQLLTKFYKVLLSFFGTGYAPIAPGTVGSVATIPLIIWIESFHLQLLHKIIIYTVITIAAIFMAQSVQKLEGLKDPQWIVLDEVVGMLYGSLAMTSVSATQLILLLIIFRFFDIIKFWPASYFDNMDHGAGTILDDVVSAGFTILVLAGINYFI
jgi:phosphatidylglycerophosphatase A